jgi:hypothetical protein
MSNPWVKSSRCTKTPAGSDCVEVQIDRDAGTVRVRNSTRPSVVTEFTADEWTAFTGGIQAGEMVV